jgi:threonylcarbamoyladenosine tRNA methylthiotransferase MtaB
MVAGNVEKGDILGLFREMAAGVKQRVQSDIRRVTEFSTPATGAFAGRTRAFLKIQDGCDCFCSYCIVPYARGKSRSLAGKEVLKRIQAIGQAGHRELVLTGINLGAYGRDLQPACDLPGLLRQVAEIKQLPRLRLSSLEPLEITDALLEFMRDKDIFCRHLHIPLQSGDDGILAAMGRVYDGAFFRGLAHKILTYLPEAAIGVDVMVGFPGEGEAEFAHTRQLVEELPLAYLHVFSYSPRPGTSAAARPDQVGVADKKRRGSIMRQLGISKREAFARQFLGREMTVLLESKRDRETGWTQGFSNNYIPVVVRNGQSSLPGSLVTVLAEEARDGKLIGRIIHHD